MRQLTIPHLWQRSVDGPLGGICEGLGRSFGLDPKLLRFLWAASILLMGSGLLLYLLLFLVLPREDKIASYQEPKVLGVCYRYARHYQFDLGLLRVITVLLFLFSCGFSLILYLILYFVAPKENA